MDQKKSVLHAVTDMHNHFLVNLILINNTAFDFIFSFVGGDFFKWKGRERSKQFILPGKRNKIARTIFNLASIEGNRLAFFSELPRRIN